MPGLYTMCRADIGSVRPLPLPHGSYCKSLAWSKDGERLLAGANTNALVVLKYPADDRYSLCVFFVEVDNIEVYPWTNPVLCRRTREAVWSTAKPSLFLDNSKYSDKSRSQAGRMAQLGTRSAFRHTLGG